MLGLHMKNAKNYLELTEIEEHWTVILSNFPILDSL